MARTDFNLLSKALTRTVAGLVLICLMLFLPAGTFDYSGGWMFIALLFVPMTIAGVVLFVKSPYLLRKRLDAKEGEKAQKTVVALSGLMFIAVFVLAGLDFRFGWTSVPGWLFRTSSAVFLLAYLMYAEVIRENAWLSRTIDVQEDQKVVSTGLYGIVRHPMYSATILLFLSIPLILGSWISFSVMLLYIPIIAARIRNEESVLETSLEGYTEYKKKVRFKVIPGLW